VNRDLELALVALYATTTEELGPDQLRQLGAGLVEVLGDLSPNDAVARAAQEVPEDGSMDQFAATQAFVLGVRTAERVNEQIGELQDLAGTLATSIGVETQVNTAADLVDVVQRVQPREAIPGEAIEGLSQALGSALVVSGDPATGQIAFSGPAARFASMLLELAWNLPPRCRSLVQRVPVGGADRTVTLVEVDVCTDLGFDHIRERVDPRNWPRYNPYFIDVRTIHGPDLTADGWCGVIRETVGPGLNGSVYVTDLAVRCVAQNQLMAVAFDLAVPPGGDRRVTVDRGFVALTDEGARRRTRVLKVYRIEDLDLPHVWVCPLWAMQIALAGWWHA
jgi:hypothetical protein